MILNYFKIAIRNLSRQKGFSFINIFGLALGISCTALIGSEEAVRIKENDGGISTERS